MKEPLTKVKYKPSVRLFIYVCKSVNFLNEHKAVKF